MRTWIFALGAALCAGGPALAQTVEAPAGTARPVAPGTAAPTGTVAPAGEVPPAGARNDPNATGPDKINGLEVPQMKDPREGGRE